MEHAQMRSFTRKHGARPSALAPAIVAMITRPIESDGTPEHNVGSCGCSGGGAGGCSGGCRCTPGLGGRPPGFDPSQIPGNYATPTGGRGPAAAAMASDGAAVLAAAGIDPAQRITDVTFAQALAIVGSMPYWRPRNFQTDAWQQYAVGQSRWLADQACVPYEDAIKDCLLMDDIVSPLVTIGAGATVDIDLAPVNGWFDLFYVDLALSTATGAVVPPEAVTMTAGQVVGCPAPECDTGNRRSGRFTQALQGCCCGRPRRAILAPAQNNTPYRTSVTNITAAAIQVQIMGKGFCSTTRVCV